MYDLSVTVDEIGGFCDLPMRIGDYFLVRGGRLYLPGDKHFCLYALQALLPLLTAKQRPSAEANDWMRHTIRVSCPDPDGRVIFRIERLPRPVEADLRASGARGTLPAEESAPPPRLLAGSGCMGCGNCREACASVHGRNEERIRPVANAPGTPPAVCHQCGHALCIHVCPTGALYRDAKTNAVLLNREICSGCGECARACPFGAIATRPDGSPLVCDLCGGDPACVRGCSRNVLFYGHGRSLASEDAEESPPGQRPASGVR